MAPRMKVDYSQLIQLQRDVEARARAVKNLNNFKDEMSQVENYMVETAQEFVRDDSNIRNHMKSEVSDNTIRLWNDAKNIDGELYSANVEYGHRDKSGKFVDPQPFLRPTLRLAIDESRNIFRNKLSAMFNSGFGGIENSTSFNGLNSGWSNNGQIWSNI